MRMRLLAGLAVVAVAAVGCGGSAAQPRVADSPSGSACVRNLTTWLQAYVDGGSDLGDYQEMGLSSAEGGALRDLERQAAALKAQGPLPSGWVAASVRQACAAISASAATQGSKPPGWP